LKKNSHDQRKLFKAVNSLLSSAKTLPLPDNCNPEAVASDIGNYFVQKVNDINKQLDNEEEDSAVKAQDISDTSDIPVSLTNFDELSIDDVQAIIGRVAKETCPLDPMPTSLVVQSLDELLPTIMSMLNLSALLASGKRRYLLHY
jgi:hypothetical protein